MNVTELLACPGMSGEIWPDSAGIPINAHGGGMLREGNLFYWYGEHKVAGKRGNLAWVGVHVYISDDLVHWRDAGIAFDIRVRGPLPGPGCVVNAPKWCAIRRENS